MYVHPRPRVEDDPNFAVRLGAMAALAFIGIVVIQPKMPTFFAIVPILLLATMRLQFQPVRNLILPVALIVLVKIIAGMFAVLQYQPRVLLAATFLVKFLLFLVIRRTGAPAAMALIIVVTAFSIAASKGADLTDAFHDSLIESLVFSLAALPVLYWLFPASTDEVYEPGTTSDPGSDVIASLIRASVLTIVSFWLFAFLPQTDILLAVAAVWPIVFATRASAFREFFERCASSIVGSGIALLILLVVSWNGHPVVLFAAMGLAALYLGERMIHGPASAPFYQATLAVVIGVIGSVINSQDPGSVVVVRVGTTLLGAGFAFVAVAILDELLLSRPRQEHQATT